MNNWAQIISSLLYIWIGAQYFLQNCMCAQRRLRSACVSAVHLKTLWLLRYPQNGLQKLWAGFADGRSSWSNYRSNPTYSDIQVWANCVDPANNVDLNQTPHYAWLWSTLFAFRPAVLITSTCSKMVNF